MYSDDDLQELVASSLRTAKGITKLKDENYALRMALDEARPLKRGREHPVDRLFYVREKLKELNAEEKHLKEEIMKDHDFIGIEFEAKVKECERKSLNRPMLVAMVGIDVVDQCYKTSTFHTIQLYVK